MFLIGATALANAPFGGADGAALTDDELVLIQSDDPLVLEQRVNAEGLRQLALTRSLQGFQIGGGGQGAQFTVLLLFSRTGCGLSDMTFTTPSPSDAGVGVFCFKAETEHELEVRKQDALARARAFVAATTAYWLGCEIAGSDAGRVFMGLIVVQKGDDAQ